VHELPEGLMLVDSYHVSRLNTNTGRLTVPMFQAVVADILARLNQDTLTPVSEAGGVSL
jgi:uracil-DNA glycosylase